MGRSEQLLPGEVSAERFAGLFAAPGETAGAAAKRLSGLRLQARQAERQAALLEHILAGRRREPSVAVRPEFDC